MSTQTLRVCRMGHKYYKSTGCPTCPVCEQSSEPKNSFPALLGAPARRALEREGIATEKDVSKYTRTDIKIAWTWPRHYSSIRTSTG